MAKLFRFLVLSLLVMAAACSKKDNSQLEKLIIQSEDSRFEYNVEVADSKEQLYHGLMGRNSLAEDSGMILDINIVPKDMDVAMWMKDTLIPLDIAFIDENGEIFYIYENAEPNSVKPIYPPKRPRAVLEVNAGQFKAKNIKAGAIVKNRLLDNMD